ncbi:MAG: hypothetical protein BGO63_02245 [Candidatus Accumulibacter sp. 66-26]|nr:HNH endonuclease [Accumulibacter sp.]OJW46533.1 MAG: hypothetical protein BGO63_02245 [Candidatus Accumulibacter sp. 66-26]
MFLQTIDILNAETTRPLILAVDITGAPHGWISWQSAVGHQAAGRVDRSMGEFFFTFRGGHSRLTGLRSELTVSSILALRGRNPHGWEPQAPALCNALLFQRDHYLCCYCGARKPAHALTRDHVRPLSRGGRDSWKNVVTACRACNQRKGAAPLESTGMAMLYVPYVPSIYEGLILRNRRILADQMEFLKNLLPDHSRLVTQEA